MSEIQLDEILNLPAGLNSILTLRFQQIRIRSIYKTSLKIRRRRKINYNVGYNKETDLSHH
jgi:hypothetical protein